MLYIYDIYIISKLKNNPFILNVKLECFISVYKALIIKTIYINEK